MSTVQDASDLSSFSTNADYLAFLSLAVDKHRLRVYNTLTAQSVAELVVHSARVSTLSWSTVNLSDTQKSSSDHPPSNKKRRKRDALPAGEDPPTKEIQVVILGLSDGTVIFFSPNHGRVLRTLSHPTSTAEIVSVVVVSHGDSPSTVWTSGADAVIRFWNPQKNEMLGCWKNEDRIPYSSLAPRPILSEGRLDILAAHHSIHLLSTSQDTLDFDKTRLSQSASFTGHASPVRQLQWVASRTPPTRFMSRADADRFLYLWEIPERSSTDGKPVASVPLDSDARTFSFAVSQNSKETVKDQTLLTLSASGKISIFPIPTELSLPTNSDRRHHHLPSLLPRSILSISPRNNSAARIVDAAFAAEEGSIHIARVVGGIRPVFDVVRYLDASGDFIPDVVIEEVKEAPTADSSLPILSQRYAEGPSLAVGSGVELGQDQETDDLVQRDIDGDLDVDLAELSLGQRLAALDARPASSESDDGRAAPKESKSSKKKNKNELTVVPANSLTRTLIQALHSSDSRLLETCLAHSDAALIRNTVRRLPPQLAIPLITACVERIGRGARAANMKGGGGGASSQRGTGLITWVKTTLTVHSGHLMTIPDLLARLSGLHATLTSRLTLQESLLSLSGRLDMVLSQIELRSSVAPAPLATHKGKKSLRDRNTKVVRYVEGESGEEKNDDGDDEQMDVDVESGDEEGSVEDVELGGQSDEDDELGENDEDDDDEDEEDDDDSEGPTMNGFIDDEAEEYSEDDDDSE